ncbi:MAG TPA: glycosyltransferase family 4 protein [Gemmatimonadota bacterium]|nr:glycosyltransferase family 4 protein [Gemmatimonadota bacterium]
MGSGLTGARGAHRSDRPVRLCLLLETYHPEVGGGESQGRLLAEGLVERGIRVTVLTRRSRRDLARRETVGGVPVRRLGPVGGGRLGKWGLLLTVPPALLTMRDSCDVLLVAGFRMLGFPAVLTAKARRQTCVLKAESNGEMSGAFFGPGLARWGLSPSFPVVRLLLKGRNAVLRRADAFVALSSAIERELQNGGVPPGRIVTIPNGVDTERFHPVEDAEKHALRIRLGLPLDAPVAAYSGRLVSYKGLPILLQAWREILSRHPSARLLLVGAGGADLHDCEAELRRYAKETGIEESVVFTGFVERVEPWLQAADLFVFPTQEEAFGIALIEAMACGLPPVTTATGGIPDIVTHERDALVVQPGTLVPLREAIHRLFDDPGLAARLGAEARRTVVRRFSRDVVLDRYAALIREGLPTPVDLP